MSALFDRHRATLDAALAAAAAREFYSAYPEVPSGRIYGETAKADGAAAFEALKGRRFDLGQPATAGWVGAEVSPYGPALDISYPQVDVDGLLAAMDSARGAWGKAAVETRTGICLEILARVNKRSFEMANAVMHTTGQAFVMAFQAGGPHAQDRGLEAVAYAHQAQTATPTQARWVKPQGKNPPLTVDKKFRTVPRGVGLVIGCATFPTWNGYPGLFASLATGNAVVVKPHPNAILPLALSVGIAREVLAEEGFDPNIVTLAADTLDAPITRALVEHPSVGIIDYTGGNAFGDWIEENAKGKQVYTEKAGINPVVILGTNDPKGIFRNLAFSLSLYSGQMCTAPQNIFVPADGIDTPDGKMSFDEVGEQLATGISKLLGDPERAAAVLGAIASSATLERVAGASDLGTVLLESRPAEHEGFPEARSVTPILLSVEADDPAYQEERFGPIAFLVKCPDGAAAVARAAASVKAKGAITAALYATDAAEIDRAEDAFAEAGVGLALNFTGGIHVNQSAAFSDFHVSGANPAGNACLTDAAFVANRFRVVFSRTEVAAEAAE